MLNGKFAQKIANCNTFLCRKIKSLTLKAICQLFNWLNAGFFNIRYRNQRSKNGQSSHSLYNAVVHRVQN